MAKDRIRADQGRDAKKNTLRHTRRSRWRSHILAASFSVVALLIFLAIAARSATVWFSRASSERDLASTISEATHTGTIIVQEPRERCKQMKFDNDSGRPIGQFKPCDTADILDANGVPMPTGTIRRLDAISKSFSRN